MGKGKGSGARFFLFFFLVSIFVFLPRIRDGVRHQVTGLDCHESRWVWEFVQKAGRWQMPVLSLTEEEEEEEEVLMVGGR